MIPDSLASEIWSKLVRGRPLDDLVPLHGGRWDLRGLKLGAQPTKKRFAFGLRAMVRVVDAALIERATWRDLDLSSTSLDGLQLSRMNIVNCAFDNSSMQNMRVWASVFRDCTFVGGNLRGSVLGGVDNGKVSSYLRVDFSRADLRRTVYEAAAFEACSFRYSKLTGVDFQTSTFKDCVFEGEVRDVMFYHRAFRGERFPPNEMINVDFRRAQLHDVAFRGLTLETVALPQDDKHIVIDDYAETLRYVIPILEKQGDETARALIYLLEIDRKWLPVAKKRAVINLEDVAETTGREGVDRLLQVLNRGSAQ